MTTPPIGPILVTGGNGFLGRAISGRMIDAGETVISLDLAPTTAPVAGVIQETGNIMDVEAIHAMAKRHGVRAIVHLAAMVIPACRADPAKGAEVNVIGHINMLEVARRLGVRRFLYTSSVAAKPREPFDSPVNLYGAYKRCCEDISRIWYLDHETPSIGLRPNVVYGPGREIGETAAITLAVKAAARGERFDMPFAGAMCFQYVDEVVDVMWRCLTLKPAGAYVSDLTIEPQTIDDVIAAIMKVSPAAKIIPSEEIRPAPPQLDNAVLRTLIGEWPTVSLEEGVRRTHAHYARSQD
ncbi:MAG: nucleoside-diphosphate sugar epimerase [Rhizobiaceae bacterium MnEN-MB40S]|nr:MAG: nucleoside-diphosphate sugar epimerase [Rhizobiaceae bacterium MnEN-MB40S]